MHKLKGYQHHKILQRSIHEWFVTCRQNYLHCNYLESIYQMKQPLKESVDTDVEIQILQLQYNYRQHPLIQF